MRLRLEGQRVQCQRGMPDAVAALHRGREGVAGRQAGRQLVLVTCLVPVLCRPAQRSAA